VHLERGRDIMSAEEIAQWNRRALIKENAHASRSGCDQRALGKFENRLGLLARDTRKPFEKLIDRSAGLEVFEKRLYRNAGISEYPCATHFVFRPVNRRASFPIEHARL
jgi:hypothetical protein